MWLDDTEFERRPLVFVEDHLYHTGEMLAALDGSRRGLLGHLTICALDRSGPDTQAAVQDWLQSYPTLQIAAQITDEDATSKDPSASRRLQPIGTGDVADASSFARFIARLLRPGGILVQDVQLSTLPFVPADRWWESIYLAATVRGLFADRSPHVRFLSNKRGYSATFGRDLADAGFDPRDVMDKSALSDVVVPTLGALFDRTFPFELDGITTRLPRRLYPLAAGEAERRDVDAAFDLVLWHNLDGLRLGGRLAGQVALRESSQEAVTWSALIAARLNGDAGLSVTALGERIGPPGAERAELINLAARHMHTLRGRLRDPNAIVTMNHCYRLNDRLAIGIVRDRSMGQ